MANRRGWTNQVACQYHPEANLIEDYHAGDMICPQCGLVVGDRVIDVGSEWRTFSNDNCGEDWSRVGGPENSLLEGSDLFTMIGPAKGAWSLDKSGKALHSNRQNMNNSDRKLINAFSTIAGMCDRINLPRIVLERAKR